MKVIKQYIVVRLLRSLSNLRLVQNRKRKKSNIYVLFLLHFLKNKDTFRLPTIMKFGKITESPKMSKHENYIK